MNEYVEVPASWLVRAKEYGTQRNQANGGNDTPAYAHGKPLPYSSLTASRLAVVAEVAAHFYFGVDPEATAFFVDRTAANYEALKASADLTVAGRKIEIRNSAVPTNALPIKEKDRDADAIVIQTHVYVENGKPTGEVYFVGWRNGTDYRPQWARRGTDYRSNKFPMASLTVGDNA